jgi:hypothetical protein
VAHRVHIGQKSIQQLGVPNVAADQLMFRRPRCRRTRAMRLRQERIQ